jgi:uncharacterized membrane protein YjjP (DUF1212 family)
MLRQVSAAPVPEATNPPGQGRGLDGRPLDHVPPRPTAPTLNHGSGPLAAEPTTNRPDVAPINGDRAGTHQQYSPWVPNPETRAVPVAPSGGDEQYQLRVSGSTTAVPQVAHPAARNLIKRMLEGEAPATVSFNIVDRLVGSPYAAPRKKVDRDAEAEEARPILVLTLDLAESMLRWGAGALEVETSVIAVTTGLGLRHVDVDITNQSVHLNWTRDGAFPVSVLRVVRSITDNYAGLALVHQLVSDISAGRTEYDEARKRLRQIRRRRLPYNRVLELGAGSLFAGLFVILIGGKTASALACVITTTLATLIIQTGKKIKVPSFFSVALATFVVTLISLLLYSWGWIHQPSTVVAGGIMLLLPSGRFVSAVQDAINGFPVTSVGRLFSATLAFGAIVTGVMLGAVVGVAAHMSKLDPTSAPPSPVLPLWILTALAVTAVVAGGITQQVAPRHLSALAVIACAGYLTHWLAVNHWDAGPRLAPAIAAVVMGLMARVIGLRIGAPALVLAVPSIVILLPGLSIFRSMYAMALDTSGMTNGLTGVLTSLTIILGIAAGVALGDTLARPITKDWNSRSRRRIRER